MSIFRGGEGKEVCSRFYCYLRKGLISEEDFFDLESYLEKIFFARIEFFLGNEERNKGIVLLMNLYILISWFRNFNIYSSLKYDDSFAWKISKTEYILWKKVNFAYTEVEWLQSKIKLEELNANLQRTHYANRLIRFLKNIRLHTPCIKMDKFASCSILNLHKEFIAKLYAKTRATTMHYVQINLYK